MTEVLRSRDGRYTIERAADRYLVNDEESGEPVEVWSCHTLTQLYDWLAANGLSVADFVETS